MHAYPGLSTPLLSALPAFAVKCGDRVEKTIGAQISAVGVSPFSLSAVSAGQRAKHGNVVGQCERKEAIVYPGRERRCSASKAASPIEATTPASARAE